MVWTGCSKSGFSGAPSCHVTSKLSFMSQGWLGPMNFRQLRRNFTCVSQYTKFKITWHPVRRWADYLMGVVVILATFPETSQSVECIRKDVDFTDANIVLYECTCVVWLAECHFWRLDA
jgi:hypothetical protein